MAENGEERSSEDLSEEASPHKVEELREKGQVAQSREITGLLALMAAGITFYLITPKLGSDLAEFMREVFRADLTARINLGDSSVLGDTLMRAFKILLTIGLPVGLVGFVLGVIGSFAQIGAIFTFDPLTPDLTKIDPLKGIQRLVSVKQLIESARLIFKVSVATFVAYMLVKAEIFKSISYADQEVTGIMQIFGASALKMFLALFGVLAVFSAFDFMLQRFEFQKKVRMTKQEAKQEHKEREGDPQIKARIRSVQREMSRRRMMQAVKKADVIITNPTHFAIAISYDKSNMAAPKVVAKGADFIAQKIKAIATEAGVPMVENVPLARTLFKTVKVGQYIPRSLYHAVAEVLAYVYRLRNRRH